MAIDPSSMGSDMDDPSQDPSAGGDDSGGGMDMSQGYCIELTVKADGSMTVGVEPLAEEQSEESGESGEGGESDEDQAQPVSSLGEALRVIKDIVAHAGDINDMNQSQDAMSTGYGKAGS